MIDEMVFTKAGAFNLPVVRGGETRSPRCVRGGLPRKSPTKVACYEDVMRNFRAVVLFRKETISESQPDKTSLLADFLTVNETKTEAMQAAKHRYESYPSVATFP